MKQKVFQTGLVFLLFLLSAMSLIAQKKCFTSQVRATAEKSAKVWQKPDPEYDPVLGYNPNFTPRAGAPAIDQSTGLANPIMCAANIKAEKGTGTTPKFYCSVEGVNDEEGVLIRYKVKPQFKGPSKDKRNGEIYGEFLSSRFSKALGFFADDEWVADVTCPDCEKSLTGKFQGAPFAPFQPAAGIELPLGEGIDENCDGDDTGAISDSLGKLLKGGESRAEIDAFKLWLAFIDHGDTKTDNQKYSCLKWTVNADNTLSCDAGQSVYYVSDMGSTFGYSKSSENKAKLSQWKGKDPIRVKDGRCTTTAKSVGDDRISEDGRLLLANELQRLLDAESSSQLITRVFTASRNQERDQSPQAWTAEFKRKALTIINAKCLK